VEAFRTQLEVALARQVEYRRIAEDGRRFASKMHCWPEIAEHTETVFYNVLDRSARGTRIGWKHREQLPTAKEISSRT
jgi:hypothetical protein